MAFFREFLRASHIVPDPRFDEDDEAALAQFLLEARMHHTAADVKLKSGFFAGRKLKSELLSAEAQNALMFVSAFLCFFISKPMTYVHEIEIFKQHFTPGFAGSEAKQAQLANALRPEFFSANVESLATTETLNRFFDMAELSASTGAAD
jgi:hypothetical protein